jgi:hypothetical protein
MVEDTDALDMASFIWEKQPDVPPGLTHRVAAWTVIAGVSRESAASALQYESLLDIKEFSFL